MILTTKEAAKILGTTPRTVQRIIKIGALKAREHKSSWLIDSRSLLRFQKTWSKYKRL